MVTPTGNNLLEAPLVMHITGRASERPFSSVDPLSSEAPGLTPYRYAMNNPIRLIDPNGMFEDGWEVNVETNEATRVSDKGGATEQHITYVNSAGERVPVGTEVIKGDGFSVKDGKATNKSVDGKIFHQHYSTSSQNPYFRNSVSTINEKYAHQLGVRMTGGLGTGFSLAAGIAWDSEGNVGLYGSAGSGMAIDGSIGVEYIKNTSFDQSFSINSLSGASIDNNGGAFILDGSFGGNINNYSLSAPSGNMYSTKSMGISASPFLLGGSRIVETMSVLKLN